MALGRTGQPKSVSYRQAHVPRPACAARSGLLPGLGQLPQLLDGPPCSSRDRQSSPGGRARPLQPQEAKLALARAGDGSKLSVEMLFLSTADEAWIVLHHLQPLWVPAPARCKRRMRMVESTGVRRWYGTRD